MSRTRLKREEELQSALVLPRRVMVIIERDMAEHITSICYEHEIDILALIHGSVRTVDDPLEHNVLIASPEVCEATRAEMTKAAKERKKVNVLYTHYEFPVERGEDGRWVPQPVFAGDEMQRLRSCYGVKEGTKDFYADVAYPHMGLFIEACGGEYIEEPVTAWKSKNAA